MPNELTCVTRLPAQLLKCATRPVLAAVICGVLAGETSAAVGQAAAQIGTTNFTDWLTNAPAVFREYTYYAPASPSNATLVLRSAKAFDHYLQGSLNFATWTNLLARTNGRSMALWSVRSHPRGWPRKRPMLAWNTNSVLRGVRGLTALSPCWEMEVASGQIPITALTRRHGYTRGHSMGDRGINVRLAGRKVWFVTTANELIERKVLWSVVRTGFVAPDYHRVDYTIVLFDKDLPDSIEPMRVAGETNALARCPFRPGAPQMLLMTEQTGNVNTDLPGFTAPIAKGGDSGSPDMLLPDGELIFVRGRSTTGPTAEMQADMDTLCRMQRLDPEKYQMQWVDLSEYPVYKP